MRSARCSSTTAKNRACRAGAGSRRRGRGRRRERRWPASGAELGVRCWRAAPRAYFMPLTRVLKTWEARSSMDCLLPALASHCRQQQQRQAPSEPHFGLRGRLQSQRQGPGGQSQSRSQEPGRSTARARGRRAGAAARTRRRQVSRRAGGVRTSARSCCSCRFCKACSATMSSSPQESAYSRSASSEGVNRPARKLEEVTLARKRTTFLRTAQVCMRPGGAGGAGGRSQAEGRRPSAESAAASCPACSIDAPRGRRFRPAGCCPPPTRQRARREQEVVGRLSAGWCQGSPTKVAIAAGTAQQRWRAG